MTAFEIDCERQRVDDLNDWIVFLNSIPNENPVPFPPVCGQCKNFRSAFGGICIAVLVPAGLWHTQCKPVTQNDPACEKYDEDCPF